MHKKHICHRTLGPDTIRLHSKERAVSKWHVLITDFGYLRTFHEGVKIETSIDKGTGFSAPEMVLRRPYTQACDVYSCTSAFYSVKLSSHADPLRTPTLSSVRWCCLSDNSEVLKWGYSCWSFPSCASSRWQNLSPLPRGLLTGLA